MIVVPEFPSITGLNDWLGKLCYNVIAAAARKIDRPVAEWFSEVEAAQSLEDLDESPSWIKSIDMKLYQALDIMLRNGGARGKDVV